MSQILFLDLDNETHAKAFLLAAGFYLANWPQEMTAKELAFALNDEEDQLFVVPCLYFIGTVDGRLKAFKCIELLARKMLEFKFSA